MKKTLEKILSDFYLKRGFIKYKTEEGFRLDKPNSIGHFRLGIIVNKKNGRTFYTPTFGVRHNKIETAIDKFYFGIDSNHFNQNTQRSNTIAAGHGFLVGLSEHNADNYGYEEANELIDLFDKDYISLYQDKVVPFFEKYSKLENLRAFYVEEKGLVPAFNPLKKYLYKIVILKMLKEDADEVILDTIDILKKTHCKKDYSERIKIFIDYLDNQ